MRGSSRASIAAEETAMDETAEEAGLQAERRGATLAGIDVLLREGEYRRSRIGLVSNPSAVTRRGKNSWKALLDAGYSIAALFGPEHGFRGDAQDAVRVADGQFLGIPQYSLYGERLEPEARMLEGLDVLVYDIQDLGCRYYTYLYTLANVMRACEGNGTRLAVLDRPDPIGGLEVEGSPIPEPEASFVGGYRLPERTGMTIGEFAAYLKGEFFPRAELEIVQLENWSRAESFEDTGLPWVCPSPNIPSPATALVYPGFCLFEGTNLSEGRGTTRPFETFGAPWIDGPTFREELAALELPGAIFTAAGFTPAFSKHAGAFCGGATINVFDPIAFKPLYAGIAALKAARDHAPERFEWKRDWEGRERFFIDRLAGGPTLRKAIDDGAALGEIYAMMTAGLESYLETRDKYLLY
jgi:uncharacterized protein YbbC (DUF1343 family)